MTSFLAKSNDGQLKMEDFVAKKFRDHLKKNDGKVYRIEPISGVSAEQRGYYFGTVIPFLKDLVESWQALTDDQLHEVLKKNFNGFIAFNPLTGRKERFGQSVAATDKRKDLFAEYLMRIESWTQENYGQTLPDTQTYKSFINSAPLK